MPNWTTNEVRFTFDMSHQKQKFLDFVKSDDNPFDFNKIIPMPEVFNRLCTNGTVTNETCWIDLSKTNGVGEQLTNLELQRLKKEQGTVSGYDWCIDNWGTKSNSAHHVVSLDTDENEMSVSFSFKTAWSPPIGIAHFLKHLFMPGINFRWFYRDQSDMFCGYLDDDIGGF